MKFLSKFVNQVAAELCVALMRLALIITLTEPDCVVKKNLEILR